MKYRKKPVVIDAVQVTAADFNGENWDESPFSEYTTWLDEAVRSGKITLAKNTNTDYAQFDIHTIEGVMRATAGDYIIQGVQGELYPCKPDIFEATYDPATKDVSEETLAGLVLNKQPEDARIAVFNHFKEMGYENVSVRIDRHFQPDRAQFNVTADDDVLVFTVEEE